MVIMKIECKNCNKHTISYCKEEMYKIINENEEEEQIKLTFVTCEECNEKYVVQIDNEETMNMLDKIKRINFVIGTKRYRFGASSNKVIKFEKKCKTLSKKYMECHNQLVEKYNNKPYYTQDMSEAGKINYTSDLSIQIENI